LENFLYGLLRGWSYGTQNVCQKGLTTAIGSFFEALDYSEIYKPWNTMKFTLAMNRLQEAGNTIYT